MRTYFDGPLFAWTDLRQRLYPAAFRISNLPTGLDRRTPAEPADSHGLLENSAAEDVESEVFPDAPAPVVPDDTLLDKTFGEISNTLWYVKARFIRHPWAEPASSSTNPRERRALRQIDRAAGALEKIGISIDDPINRRFPHGAEAMMQPLDYQSRPDLEEDTVIETSVPIVFRDDRLIRRGEVFVGVPSAATEQPTKKENPDD